MRPGSVLPDDDKPNMPMEYQMGAASYYSGPVMQVASYVSGGLASTRTDGARDWSKGYEPDDPEVLGQLFGVRFRD